ncbi:MAG: response regulator transcription factor [Oscillospiraceae bacterium]|nr:response regulator transcription factor [Oscillospiraceae bacterium]
MRILIVEDEVRLAQTLSVIISRGLAPCDAVYDGETGLDYAMSGAYDAIVLDIMLPKLDGFSLLRRLRRKDNKTPVLILSARNETVDRVYGLDYGADYYLSKPFDNAELLACLRSILRRQEAQTPEELQFGDLRLLPSVCNLSCGEKTVKLTVKEKSILELMMRNSASSISKDLLLTKVWGFDSDAKESNVEVYISFLRKKIKMLNSRVRIASIRFEGYHLEVLP